MWQLQEQCTIQFSYFLLLYTETEFQKRLIIIYLWQVSFNCSVRYFEKRGPRTYRFNAVYFRLLHEKSANLLNKIAHFIRIADIIHTCRSCIFRPPLLPPGTAVQDYRSTDSDARSRGKLQVHILQPQVYTSRHNIQIFFLWQRF